MIGVQEVFTEEMSVQRKTTPAYQHVLDVCLFLLGFLFPFLFFTVRSIFPLSLPLSLPFFFAALVEACVVDDSLFVLCCPALRLRNRFTSAPSGRI